MSALMSIPAFAQWQPFKWAEFRQNKATVLKAAILLPVELDGIRCTMQLDTGVGLSLLYRNSTPSRYSKSLDAETIAIKKFSMGRETSANVFQLKYEKANSAKDCGPKGDRIVGTIGNDFFARGTLSLDLAAGRYQFNRGPFRYLSIDRSKALDIEVIKTPKWGVFPIVKLAIGDVERKMLFDTGSASMGLIVFLRKNWLDLVGLQDVNEVTPIYIARFGQQVPCYTAPISHAVSLGKTALGAVKSATYCFDPRDSHGDDQVFGILGLAPFYQSIVSVDYVSEKMYVEAATFNLQTDGRH
ncbi:MAG: hypothetical protein ABIY86_02070 [Rhodoferax sp.]